jgi:hypothetical protein
VLAFGTNILHGGPLQSLGDSRAAQALSRLTWSPRSPPPGMRSTVAAFVGELIRPQPDPYRTAADWLRRHVAPGASVWVQPFYMTPPLLFHAPHVIYAWQIPYPPPPQFRDLPPIHFQGQVLPDYCLVFGRLPLESLARLQARLARRNMAYELVATLDCYWRDNYRPELTWRAFHAVTGYDRASDAIYVLRRPPTR